MPFLVLLVLTLVCVQVRWPGPPEWLGLGGSVLVTALAVAGFAGAAFAAGGGLRHRITADPTRRAAWLAEHAKTRRRLFLGLLMGYLLTLYLGGWGWSAQALLTPGDFTLPGAELLVFVPFLAGLFALWATSYDVELALSATAEGAEAHPFPGRRAYVTLQARHNLLLALPPLLLLVLQQLVFAAFPALQKDEQLLPLVALTLLTGVFVGIPWMLRLFLGLKPLPEGPLRTRLEAAARRLGFRCNDILLWDTRGTVANAMVTGPMPFLRYVVLTDRLIEEMTPDEVEAVFGHEVGHVKHHHMLFYFAFLMVSLVVLAGVWNAAGMVLDRPGVRAFLGSALPAWDDWQTTYGLLTTLPVLALVGGYIFVVFGYLSRRCERQADIYGCRTVSVPVFIEALEKVGRLNGISRDRPGWLSSWQHSTIALRVEFLRRMSADPAVEPRFQRHVGWVKWGMAFCLALLLVVLFKTIGPENVWTLRGL